MAKRMRCPRCRVLQDPNRPVCTHMMGRKGGRLGQKTIRRLYGHAHYAKAGKAGAEARWGAK